MSKLFLKAKHWQLFLLMFVVPIAAWFLLVGIAVQTIKYEWVIILAPIVMTVYLFSFFGWMWSIGTELSKKLPREQPFSRKRFKAFLLFPALYISLISILGLLLFIFLPTLVNLASDESTLVSLFMVIFLIHLFAMFCMFHSIYQCAKIVKAIELNRRVTFGDFVGEFFLFWFFIIGVWILQPKINDLAEREYEDDLTDHLVE